jgi:hypothetical protein
MKSVAAVLIGLVPFAVLAAANGHVAHVHKVYLLPMTNGLDQYLANRLTNLHVFQVVADPRKADAVLTDRLGGALESRLHELFPEPAPKAAEQGAAAKGGNPDGNSKNAEQPKPAFGAKGDTGVPLSSFHRAKGTVFLVDAHDFAVLWSVYDQARNSSPAEMDRTAERIASSLRREVKKK